jgi:hypothetical protein
MRLRERSSYILTIMLMLYFSAGRLTAAQRFLTTFGRTYDAKAPQKALGIIAGDFAGEGRPGFAVYNSREIFFYGADSSGLLRAGAFTFPQPVDRALAARCNGDRFTDLILFSENPPAVSALLGRGAGRFGLAWSTLFQGQYDRIAVGDVNDDGRTDILLYGKRELGCLVYLGKGDGKFLPAQTIFPEYSFSAVWVRDMNDDGAAEIVGANWISHELLIFQNFGRMKFSEPVVLSFPVEPNLLVAARLSADSGPGLIVGSTDEDSARVFWGDGLGNYVRHQAVGMKRPPALLSAADCNGDGRNDLCALSGDGKTFSVLLNDGSGGLREPSEFSAGVLASDFCIVPVPASDRGIRGPSAVNAAILDNSQGAVHYLESDRLRGRLRAPAEYATGAGPQRVFAADVDGDGWKDLMITNRISGTISVYLNTGGENITGQIALGVDGDPTGLSGVRKDDSTSTFITVQPVAGRLSVSELRVPSFSVSSFSLPTQGSTQVLHAWYDSGSSLHIMTFEAGELRQKPAVMEFEQISQGRFTEKNVTPETRFPILAVAGLPSGQEIWFATNDSSRHTGAVYRSGTDSLGRFSRTARIMPLDEELHPGTLIWQADLNGDSLADLVIYHPAPEEKLTVALGASDTSLVPVPRGQISPVVVDAPEYLVIKDVNGDGVPDIVVDNDRKKAVELYLGQGNGTFLPAVRLASADGIGGFALERLTAYNGPSLILTDALHGKLRIIPLEER